jgi:SAM-dependent methyltransferase
MTVFGGDYSRYYDALYPDKDYDAEAAFVGGVLDAHFAPGGPRRLLELGCGTGRHAVRLARGGREILGVDRSEGMIARGRQELQAEPSEVRARVSFTHGDVRTFRSAERFDAVVSLFHVMSYLTADEDLGAAFETARAHLGPGGLFLFDAWYGPAVLADPPGVRVKRVPLPDGNLLRLSEPRHSTRTSQVEVQFTVFAFDPAGAVRDVARETHLMRYWFHNEIEAAARRARFEVLELGEWMTRRAPEPPPWNAYWVLRATP